MEIKGWPDTLAAAPWMELTASNKHYSWNAHQIKHVLFPRCLLSVNRLKEQTNTFKSINNSFREQIPRSRKHLYKDDISAVLMFRQWIHPILKHNKKSGEFPCFNLMYYRVIPYVTTPIRPAAPNAGFPHDLQRIFIPYI